MKQQTFDQRNLVEEIVTFLLEKFEQLPVTNRCLIAMTTIEAAAWVTAMETAANAKKHDKSEADIEERLESYISLYSYMLQTETQKLRDKDQ